MALPCPPTPDTHRCVNYSPCYCVDSNATHCLKENRIAYHPIKHREPIEVIVEDCSPTINSPRPYQPVKQLRNRAKSVLNPFGIESTHPEFSTPMWYSNGSRSSQ